GGAGGGGRAPGGGVCVLFARRDVELGVRLRGVSLRIAGGVTAILGYSGAGKSSLLSVLAGFEQPTCGSVERADPGAGAALPCYWVPQSGGLWSHVSVRGHVELVSAGTADEILPAFDLWERRDACPGDLSQGERSRLSVVRALSAGAAVLLMDEPLSHVDPVRKPGYWEELSCRLRATGASLVFSSHEPGVVLRHAERVVCLRAGRVWHESAVRDLYERAPDRQLGEFLGPLNWLDGALAVALGLGAEVLGEADRRGGVCVRPERLRLRAAEGGVGADVGCVAGGRWVRGGVVRVLESRLAGGLAETVVVGVCGRECRLLHVPGVGLGVGVGSSVYVEVSLPEGAVT
ncbi:MAG: ATP-binding cassette domain-containing protein, partial [Planctomyces sp.]